MPWSLAMFPPRAVVIGNPAPLANSNGSSADVAAEK